MRLTGRTILITGGSSGIGKGLAQAFHERGNQVIITGRREKMLAETAKRFKGMEAFAMDVSKEADVRRLLASVSKKYPALDVLINNAGIMRYPDFSKPESLGDGLFDEVETNLKGLIRMTAFFLPLLLRQKEATLINVSSGLAYVPLAFTPIYCGTKAAVHSFTDSLRHQLRKTAVQVVEIAPPGVETGLGKAPGRPDGGYRGMELGAFIAKTMKALKTNKGELPIAQAKFLKLGARLAPSRFFRMLNPSK